MIMMPAWSRMREDKKIECLACNMLIDNCSCVWAAIRDLHKFKDDIHLRMDNMLELHRNKFSGIQSDICRLIDELREHQKQPHQQPLYGRKWIDSHATDAAHVLGKNMDEKSQQIKADDIFLNSNVIQYSKILNDNAVLRGQLRSYEASEGLLHTKDERIRQLEAINAALKNNIEKLECELIAANNYIARANKKLDQKDKQIHNRGCCL